MCIVYVPLLYLVLMSDIQEAEYFQLLILPPPLGAVRGTNKIFELRAYLESLDFCIFPYSLEIRITKTKLFQSFAK